MAFTKINNWETGRAWPQLVNLWLPGLELVAPGLNGSAGRFRWSAAPCFASTRRTHLRRTGD